MTYPSAQVELTHVSLPAFQAGRSVCATTGIVDTSARVPISLALRRMSYFRCEGESSLLGTEWHGQAIARSAWKLTLHVNSYQGTKEDQAGSLSPQTGA